MNLVKFLFGEHEIRKLKYEKKTFSENAGIAFENIFFG